MYKMRVVSSSRPEEEKESPAYTKHSGACAYGIFSVPRVLQTRSISEVNKNMWHILIHSYTLHCIQYMVYVHY